MKPKVVRSVHYCPRTNKHEVRDYVDAADLEVGLPVLDSAGREIPDRLVNISTSVHPTQDKERNPLEMEFGLSTYKDHQTAVLQEMPERAPVGQLPRSIDLVLDHDLVDRVKPGDRVRVTGIYRALATASSGQSFTDGTFKTVILVNDLQILGNETSNLTFSPDDVRNIRALSKREDILSVLGRSVAPSVHGHGDIKEALVLQLLSGCEKNLENGAHLRGDINVLMVGDPSTAKSQLLRAAMRIAPLAVSTTGRGSSGVGLTAAVTTDSETGERRLEAGAMVLADRGIVCVDEFDKMAEADRAAIHEAMEQQTVTISKAGIHASLNARCSVLAAANPVYGRYDRRKRIQENVGLPDSLLSRFDLLFVVLDRMDPEIDRKVAAHVVEAHRYRPEGPGDGEDVEDDDDDDEEEERLNGPVGGGDPGRKVWTRSRFADRSKDVNDESDDDADSASVLHGDFLRKYLHFAKTRIQPYLTDGAREAVAARYAEMRSRQDRRTLPVTVRTLETLIRLSSAHAKARLSNRVEQDPDVTVATELLSYALYHEAGTMGDRRRKQQSQEDAEKEGTHDADAAAGGEGDLKRKRIEEDDEEESLRKIKARIWRVLTEEGQVRVDAACPDVTDRSQVNTALVQMEKDGRVMLSDGEVFQI